MHTRLAQAVGVGQLRADLPGAAADRGQHPQTGQARQLTHERGHRHADVEQRIPHLGPGQRCVGQHLPGQAVVADDLRPGAGDGRLLRLDESLDE